MKFKEFNNLLKEHKKTKSNKKFNSTHNSFFKNYLKNIKTIGLDKIKKPEINPFSDLFFTLADKKQKYMAKSKSSNNFAYTPASSSNFQFNIIECLVLNKIIDEKEYSKYNENEKNNSKSLKIKELKNQIKTINKKKKFPQHLIRRFEANRKINYFPEKYLYFVK